MWVRQIAPRKRQRRLIIEQLESRLPFAAGFAEFVDPHPAPGNQFGSAVVPLATGNVVITSPFDDAGGTDAGAVYLFNGATGRLISTLTGSHANDHVGGAGAQALTNGNFVVASPDWDNGTVADAGAATFGNGLTGVSGVVSGTNSLVGTTASDRVSIISVTTLSNAITALPNGNYLVSSEHWTNGDQGDAGAVTFGNGITGVTGPVTPANSLVGTKAGNSIGAFGIVVLTNNNYVVKSPYWDSGSFPNVGAVTWGSGETGITGAVSPQNSLVGTLSGEEVGSGNVVALPSGNYLVKTSTWNNYRGAVTFGDGLVGVTGPVTPANSLVGSSFGDFVSANNGVRVLANGNYIVSSPFWNNGNIQDAGAVTFGSGLTGVRGEINATNSLVGTTADDSIGSGSVALTNGNYVVASGDWDNGALEDVGIIKLVDGTTGAVGVMTAANSLVGSTAGDKVGSRGVIPLTNGNFVVMSPNWDNGSVVDAGAATFGDGLLGVTGQVNAANSLVGSTTNDFLGTASVAGPVNVTALKNGNYVVSVRGWDNGATPDVGAVTFGNGVTGTSGAVSAANSLIGATAADAIGNGAITALPNGNYVVSSPAWNNGAVTKAGAVTFGSGTTGISGVVGPLNSLVGSTKDDQVGLIDSFSLFGQTAVTNSNYVVRSSKWDNGDIVDAGAVTLGSGTMGISGVISAANSLVGAHANDQLGSGGVRALPSGNYEVNSPNWQNGTLANAGAMTFGDGNLGVSGLVSSSNSLIGSVANAGLSALVRDDVNETFFGRFLTEGPGRVRVASQLDGLANRWHNAAHPLDADNNGQVVPLDALLVINYLNAGFPTAVSPTAPLGGGPGFLDTSGNNQVEPLDALLVINYLNALAAGDGEAPVSTGDSPDLNALLSLLASDTAEHALKRRRDF